MKHDYLYDIIEFWLSNEEYEYYLSTGGEYALIDKNDLATASGSVLINAESITNNSVKVVVKDNAGNITTQHEMVK